MKCPVKRSLLVVAACALLGSLPALAADDLEPGVNTSAPDRLAVPPRSLPTPAAVPAPTTSTVVPPTPAPAPAPANTPPAPTAGKAPAARIAAPGGAATRDRVELENTQITGNRELPKVMYVVPWKKPDLGDFGGRPAKSLLDELLEPVDRDVFRRQNRYFEALQPDAGQTPVRDEK
jgi:hypothetical protein